MLKPEKFSWFICCAGVCATKAIALQPSDVLLFSKGPVSLRPQLDLTEVWTDNVYYTEQGEISDFITIVSPGLDLSIGRPDGNRIALTYVFDQFKYFSEDSLDAQQHHLSLVSDLTFNRLKIEGEDRVDLLSGVLTGTMSSQRRKVDRTVFSDIYRFSYTLTEKTGVYVAAAHGTTDYEKTLPFFDQRNLQGTVGVDFKALNRTTFFGEGYYGQTTVDPNLPGPNPPDSTYFGGFIGARGNFTEKISGLVKAGYEMREFADKTPGPSSPVVEAVVNYAISEKTAANLSYSRRTSVSAEAASQAYTGDIVVLKLTQAIGNSGKFKVGLRAEYDQYAYEPTGGFANRQDRTIKAGLTCSYDFRRWLSANLGYTFEKFDTSLIPPVGFDYIANQVMLTLAIGY